MEPTLDHESESRKLSGLVVDSETISRMIHTALLRACGIAAQAVETGTQAMELYASGSRFDLVVIDLSFSNMRPAETARKLRTLDPGAKMIGITADDFHVESRAFIDAGGSTVFEKPMDREMLREVMQNLDL
ncbi:hypothetical protein Dimus_032614 [Dionaea muscipula]